MKLKTAELTGPALDWAVTKCEEDDNMMVDAMAKCGSIFYGYHYSTDWSQGGPIIERELLEVSPHFCSASAGNKWKGAWEWVAYVLGPNNQDDNSEQHGSTPLIAAMRCYVASKLGNEVEVPEELA